MFWAWAKFNRDSGFRGGYSPFIVVVRSLEGSGGWAIPFRLALCCGWLGGVAIEI